MWKTSTNTSLSVNELCVKDTCAGIDTNMGYTQIQSKHTHTSRHSGIQTDRWAFRKPVTPRLSPEAPAKLLSTFPDHSRGAMLGSGRKAKDRKVTYGQEQNF